MFFDWVVFRFTYASLPLLSFKEDFQRDYPRIYSMLNFFSTNTDSSWLKWNARELHIIAEESNELDADAITTAYTISMNTNYLHHASVCITDLTLATARKCFRAIRSANIAHWGDDHTDAMESVHPCMWSGAIISLMDAASQDSPPAPPSIAEELEDMYESMSILGNSHDSSALSHTRLVSVDFARIARHYNSSELPSEANDAAESVSYYRMRDLASNTAGICLGNDVRQTGVCGTIQLARYQN